MYFSFDLPRWADWFMWSHLGAFTALGVILALRNQQTPQQQFNYSKNWTMLVLCPWVAFLNPLWWVLFWLAYATLSFLR